MKQLRTQYRVRFKYLIDAGRRFIKLGSGLDLHIGKSKRILNVGVNYSFQFCGCNLLDRSETKKDHKELARKLKSRR